MLKIKVEVNLLLLLKKKKNELMRNSRKKI